MASPSTVIDLKAQRRLQSAEILNRAYRTQKVQKSFTFRNLIKFDTITDHILASGCKHEDEASFCMVCVYEKNLELPNLPDMIYDSNRLKLSVFGKDLIEFNSFDALKLVDAKNLPNVQVSASEVWQGSRPPLPPTPKNYDWTFTSDYSGTLGDVVVEETEESIDLEVLKRQDPILFHDTIPLYEDEMDDNGCTEMTVRIRVMTTGFFIVCRFYLRVDRVLLRVYDTRIYGDLEKNYMLRECTKREAHAKDWTAPQKQHALDPAQLWQFLPVVEIKRHKIFYPEKEIETQ